MGSGRLALLAGLVAAGLSALLAGGAGVTEAEMLTRSALAFVLFALLTKGVAEAVIYLVPEVTGETAKSTGAKGGKARTQANKAGPGRSGAVKDARAKAPAAPDGRGGRLNVVLPGTSPEEMLNAGTGKEVAG